MSIDYQIFLDEDIEFTTILARVSERMPLSVYSQTMLELVACDKERLIAIHVRRGARGREIPFPEHLDFLPRTKLLISPDKQRVYKAKEPLIQIAAILLKLTSASVTMLMNCELPLLRRASGQPLELFTPDFWNERLQSIINA
jgi:hypothetical protein